MTKSIGYKSLPHFTNKTDYTNLAGRFFPYSTTLKNHEFVFKATHTTAKGQIISSQKTGAIVHQS